ncbi:MAG TPA: aminoglycoside phosphotransferase family protein [Mycobacteriales bacterium]|nr:aminoglycoside phosphotransferase family protein [Mycobacteriales bacterium]
MTSVAAPDDGLALLTGPDAEDLLAAALATGGDELVSWRVRSVDHRPGRSTTASYAVRLRGPAGECREVLGASTGLATRPDLPEGVLVLSDGERSVAVWRWPLDPGLPALPAAVSATAVRALLADVGVEAPEVSLDVRAYRPRRRAVVEVRTPDRRLFLKVLRPSGVEATHGRHRLLRGAGVPVPPSLGWTDDGLLVLEGLPGTSMRARLRSGDGALPDGAALLDVLERLPPEVCGLPHRRAWADAAGHYAEVVAGALPEEAARCRDIAADVTARTAGAPADQPVHGDFYETQLLLDGPRVSGLLDVDTAGPGRRADDLACLLGHATVLAVLDPPHAAATRAAAAAWLAAFERAVDPAELRARAAGVVLSLATGPHRVQEPGWPAATRARLDLAEAWLASRPGSGLPGR